MKVVFYRSAKEREATLCGAFLAGVRIFADCGEEVALPAEAPDPEADVAVFVGVKSLGLHLPEECLARGQRVLFIDKGHMGRGEYYRFSIDTFYPTRYLDAIRRDARRLEALRSDGVLPDALPPMSADGRHVVFAGSSQKYCTMMGLGDATEYARGVIARVLRDTGRHVVYRPKPSWTEAVPVDGAFFSRPPRTLADELRGAYMLVTHGSNAAVEAVIHGVPVCVLGDGVARPLGVSSLDDIGEPLLPSEEERLRWLCTLSYMQFTLQEMRSGEAWEEISKQMMAVPAPKREEEGNGTEG